MREGWSHGSRIRLSARLFGRARRRRLLATTGYFASLCIQLEPQSAGAVPWRTARFITFSGLRRVESENFSRSASVCAKHGKNFCPVGRNKSAEGKKCPGRNFIILLLAVGARSRAPRCFVCWISVLVLVSRIGVTARRCRSFSSLHIPNPTLHSVKRQSLTPRYVQNTSTLSYSCGAILAHAYAHDLCYSWARHTHRNTCIPLRQRQPRAMQAV